MGLLEDSQQIEHFGRNLTVVSSNEIESGEIEVNNYRGICMYAEPLWLGYLSYCYLNRDSPTVQPAIVESRNKDGTFLGLAIRKYSEDIDKYDFGEVTDLILWSPYDFIEGHIVSRERDDLITRELGIVTDGFVLSGMDNRQDVDDSVKLVELVRKQMASQMELDSDLSEIEILEFLIDWVMRTYQIDELSAIYP